jgi:hypothetical protein
MYWGLPGDNNGMGYVACYRVVRVNGRGEGEGGCLLVDVACASVRGICNSPRLAVHSVGTAGTRFSGPLYAWWRPCICALMPVLTYVCGRCVCDYNKGGHQLLPLHEFSRYL